MKIVFDKVSIRFLFLIIILSVVFYGSYINLYFSQDDFFHLKVSFSNGTLQELFDHFLFKPFAQRGGIYFYRPIFREFLYDLYYQLFGFNPYPFRLTQFALHFVNIVLVFFIFAKITKNKTVSLLTSLFFALAVPNVGVFSYLAGGIQVSGMLMFSLISIMFMLLFNETKRSLHRALWLIFFLLALSSHELSLILPAIYFLILALLREGLSFKNIILDLKNTSIFFLFSLLLVLLEVMIIGLPSSQSQYNVSLSVVNLFNSYFWYVIWSFGVPEMLLDFVGPSFKLNLDLMKYWGNYFSFIFPAALVIFSILGFSCIRLIKNRTYLLMILWFLVGLVPVVFLPLHKLYYYLYFVLPPVGCIFGYSVWYLYKKFKILSLLLVFLFVSTTIATIHLSSWTYWSINRSKIAKSLIDTVKTTYPTIESGSSIYFTNDPDYPVISKQWGNSSKQASIILSGSDALQVLYKDFSLRVYYEDTGSPPEISKIYKLKAIINVQN